MGQLIHLQITSETTGLSFSAIKHGKRIKADYNKTLRVKIAISLKSTTTTKFQCELGYLQGMTF